MEKTKFYSELTMEEETKIQGGAFGWDDLAFGFLLSWAIEIFANGGPEQAWEDFKEGFNKGYHEWDD